MLLHHVGYPCYCEHYHLSTVVLNISVMLHAYIQAEELAKSKLEKPKRLQQQAHREWQEIKHGSLKFQRRQQEALAIRQLTKPQLVAFFQVLLRTQ